MSRSMRTAWAALVAAAMIAAAGSAVGASLVTVRDGRLTARVDAIPLADLKPELEAAAAVDIRMANAEVAQHPVTATLDGEGVARAVAYVLRDFNFTQFTDARSGREVYLVTSLADPNAPRIARKEAPPVAAAPAPPVVKAPAMAATPAPTADGKSKSGKSAPAAPGRAVAAADAKPSTEPRSLDDVQPIAPPTFEAYADQSIVDGEMARVRQQTLDRANAVLGNPAYGPELQRQALNELAGLGDPRSLQTLQQLITDRRVVDAPMAADAVAQAAWRYAAQQEFANADANRLLQTMAESTQPQIRAVGQAAVRDSQSYLAKNAKP